MNCEDLQAKAKAAYVKRAYDEHMAKMKAAEDAAKEAIQGAKAIFKEWDIDGYKLEALTPDEIPRERSTYGYSYRHRITAKATVCGVTLWVGKFQSLRLMTLDDESQQIYDKEQNRIRLFTSEIEYRDWDIDLRAPVHTFTEITCLADLHPALEAAKEPIEAPVPVKKTKWWQR